MRFTNSFKIENDINELRPACVNNTKNYTSNSSLAQYF